MEKELIIDFEKDIYRDGNIDVEKCKNLVQEYGKELSTFALEEAHTFKDSHPMDDMSMENLVDYATFSRLMHLSVSPKHLFDATSIRLALMSLKALLHCNDDFRKNLKCNIIYSVGMLGIKLMLIEQYQA